jgi:FkbM family methyltransferase
MTFKTARKLLPPLLADALRAPAKRLMSPRSAFEERELARLIKLPPNQRATTNLFGAAFEVVDGASFAHSYLTFFRSQLYRFDLAAAKPFILDCGANIGISVAWWKNRYPAARVVAFEPDPEIFEVLKRNCARFRDVELVNAALWDREEELPFSAKGGEGGHLSELSANPPTAAIRPVRCVRLRDFLGHRCDFLKMDIEGAELEVLPDCEDLLGNVERAFIEYHSFVGRPQGLARTLAVLEHAGFRMHIRTEMPSPRPLEELLIYNEKDLRLAIFCYRDRTSPRLAPWI